MKKRILVLLAVLALMVSCMVFAVSAAEGDEVPYVSALANADKCPHCGKTISEITTAGGWTEVTAATAATTVWTENHLWIKESITLTATPGWGRTVDQIVLVRSSNDLSVDVTATPVVVTLDAADQFNGNSANYLIKKLTIVGENATLEGKKVASSNGGLFRIGNATVDGKTVTGTLCIYGDVTIRPTATYNKANSGGLIANFAGTLKATGVTFVATTSGQGGAIFANNGTTTLTNCKFIPQDGVTLPTGGAITINSSSANLTIDGCTFENFNTKSNGAAITVTTCKKTTIKDSTFTNCDTTTSGGALYIGGGTVEISGNTSITECSAKTGGAIYLNAGTLNIKGGTIDGNSATDAPTSTTGLVADLNPTGGNIYVQRNATLNVSGGTIKNGSAADGAGGNIGARGEVNVSGGTIQDGTAKQGGNIYCCDTNAAATKAVTSNQWLDGQLHISGGTISGGTATNGNGGNIYVNGADLAATIADVNAKIEAGKAVTMEVFDASDDGFTITGGTITGGKTGDGTEANLGKKNSGATIYVKNARLVISQAEGKTTTITGGESFFGATIAITSNDAATGGHPKNNTALVIKGGTINGGTAPATSSAQGKGGTIHVDNAADLDIQGGAIYGGRAYKGGAIFIQNADEAKMSGGDIYATNAWTEGTGDSATTNYVNQGGAIFMAGDTFEMSGGTFHGSKRTDETILINANNGGIAYLYGEAKLQLSDTATIDGGYSAGNGGAIFSLDGGDISLAGTSAIKNAYSRGNGGAIAFGGTATNATFTMTAGEISDCVCYGSTGGGAIYATGGADLTISGGKIEGCYDHYFTKNESTGKYSNSNGGMLYLTGSGTVLNFSGGTLYGTGNESDRTKVGDFSNNEISLRSGAVMNMSGNAKVEIANDAAVIQLVQSGATLTLRDNASIANAGGVARDINIAGNYECNLLIDNNWTGTAKLSNFNVNLGVAYADANRHIACGTWNEKGEWVDGGYMHSGKLVMDIAKVDGKDYYDEYMNPTIIAGVTGDGTMTHCAALVVNTNDGTVAGYTTGQAAIDDASVAGTYAKLYDKRENLTIAEGTTAYIDVNGFAFNVDNKGTLYAFDSTATTTKNGGGRVTLAEGNNAPARVYEYDNGYAISSLYKGQYLFYRVEMKVTNVSLRPGEEGVYFTAQFKGDDDALALVSSMGVAVTTTEDELNYNSLEQFLYTTATKKNGAHNGVLISNILGTDPAAMANRVTTKIQAAAYFTVDGVTYMVPAAKKISLHDVVNAVATVYGAEGKTADLNEQQKTNMYELYKACKAITVEEGADPLVWTAIADFDAMIEAENQTQEPETGDDTGADA